MKKENTSEGINVLNFDKYAHHASKGNFFVKYEGISVLL